MNPDESLPSLVYVEWIFVNISSVYLYFQLDAVFVEGLEYFNSPEGVDSSIHSWYLVRIPNLHLIQPEIVHEKL